ncbi:MAG TPA: type IV toxin-antitoxin system AbiEi family antitoxin domain-containing protein [Solirubrobacteraceae bacterium]|jgi:hypothetical protein
MSCIFDIAARIAARQHGRVSRRQLVAAGIDRHAIQRWLEDGRLHRAHHGVYAVGHPGRTMHGDYMAAVLAGGGGAVLSHRAAAHLLSLAPGGPSSPEITVPTTAHRRRPGIVVHRTRALDPLDVASFAGIPVTTVPRVLLDLAPSLEPARLARACHEGWVRHGTSPRLIEACIARNPAKPGAARLRRATGADITLSVLEDGFLALLREHGLPLPRTNVALRGDTVDCHWPAHGLTVELLSYRYHGTRAAFETDVARRRRSSHLAFTYGDVFERPARTATELAVALGRG